MSQDLEDEAGATAVRNGGGHEALEEKIGGRSDRAP